MNYFEPVCCVTVCSRLKENKGRLTGMTGQTRYLQVCEKAQWEDEGEDGLSRQP